MDPVAAAEDQLAGHPEVGLRVAQVGRQPPGHVPTGRPVAQIGTTARALDQAEVAGRGRQVPVVARRVRRVVAVKVLAERETVEDLVRVGLAMMHRAVPPISAPEAVMGVVMTHRVVNDGQARQAGLVRGEQRVARVANAMTTGATDREKVPRLHVKREHRASRETRLSVVRRKYEQEAAGERDSIKRRQRPIEPLNVGSMKVRCVLRQRQRCNVLSRSVAVENLILRLLSAFRRPFHRRNVQRVFANG